MQVLVVVGGSNEISASDPYSDATYTFKTGDSAWNVRESHGPLGSFVYNGAITVDNVIYLVGK